MKPDKELQASGHACINLTPEINQAMKEMEGVQIIEVFNDDPASRIGVPAWCRLTGHSLVKMTEINATDTLFYIQKKST